MTGLNRRLRWCPKDHGAIQASGVVFKHASSMNFYYRYNGDVAFPYGLPYSVSQAWTTMGFMHNWRTDPVWTELKVAQLARRNNKVVTDVIYKAAMYL